MIIDMFLYPPHPVRCNITGPSNSGKLFLLTKLILDTINEFENL